MKEKRILSGFRDSVDLRLVLRAAAASLLVFAVYVIIAGRMQERVVRSQEKAITEQLSLQVRLAGRAFTEIFHVFSGDALEIAEGYARDYAEGRLSAEVLAERLAARRSVRNSVVALAYVPATQGAIIYDSTPNSLGGDFTALLARWAGESGEAFRSAPNGSVYPMIHATPVRQYAAVAAPVLQDGDLAGISIVAVDLADIFDSFAVPMRSGKYGAAFLLDEAGTVLFDHETEIIGKNIFHGLHEQFPELLAIDRQMITRKSGTGSYSFTVQRGGPVALKLVAWDSADAAGKRIIIAMSILADDVGGAIAGLKTQQNLIAALLGLTLLAWLAYDMRRTVARSRERDARRMEMALEGAELGVWNLDVTVGRVFGNERLVTMLGFKPGEIGPDLKDWEDLRHPDDKTRVARAMEKCLAGEGRLDVEYRLRTAAGDWRWVLARGQVVDRSGDESPLRLAGTHLDITDRHRLQADILKSEQRMSLALNVANEGYWDWDLETGSLYFNDCLNNLLSTNQKEEPPSLEGLFDTIAHEDIEQFRERLDALQQGREYEIRGDVRVRAPEGGTCTLHYRSRVVEKSEAGLPRRIITAFLDIEQLRRIQDQLQKKNEEQELLLETMLSHVWFARSSSRYSLVNSTHAAFLRRDVGFLEGRAFTDVYPYDEAQELVRLHESVFRQSGRAGDRPVTKRLWLTSGKGERRLLEIQAVGRRAPDGSVEYVACSAVDMTEAHSDRQNLRRTLQEFEALFDVSPVGIVFQRGAGRIVRVNEAGSVFFRASVSHVVGSTMEELFSDPESYRAFKEQSDKTLSGGGVYSGEITISGVDGEDVLCRIAGRALNPPDLVKGVLWVLEDISAQRRDRQAMLRVADELHQTREAHQQTAEELASTLTELEDVKIKAESAVIAKSEFLARMSHEIRTPMNAILGLAVLALETELTPRQKDYLEKVVDASRNLRDILSDIMDFSRIEAGRMELEKSDFDLRTLVGQCLKAVVPGAREKGLEVVLSMSAEVPFALRGDEARLRQVMGNLLQNAVKFTQSGEVFLGISVRSLDDSAAALRFSVKDTGIGIASEALSDLFEPFTQADGSPTRKFGGTGLGLSIASRTVEQMGGRLELTSSPGEGSEFYFTITLELQPGRENSVDWPQDCPQGHAFVASPSASVRREASALLRGFGFSVRNGADLADLVREAELQAAVPQLNVLLIDSRLAPNGPEAAFEDSAEVFSGSVPAFVQMAYAPDGGEDWAAKVRLPLDARELRDALLEVADVTCLLAESDTSSDQGAGPGWKVLLVEDNEINQHVARDMLVLGGMNVTIAANGKEALEALSGEDFDIILLDLQMPEMDGYETVGHIRRESRLAEIPVIAMTAHAMSGDRERCLEAGMNDYIAKPIDRENLLGVINHWLEADRPDLPYGLNLTEGGLSEIKEKIPEGEITGESEVRLMCERFADDRRFLARLLVTFEGSHRDSASRVRAHLAEGRRDRAADELHTLKGVAGNMGAAGLAFLAREAEEAIREADDNRLGFSVDSVERVIEEIFQASASEFQEEIENYRIPDQDKDTAARPDAKMFREFAGLLAARDFRASRRVNDVASGLARAGLSEEAGKIREAVTRFEYSDALALLEAAMHKIGI